jgi:hypothetical protein
MYSDYNHPRLGGLGGTQMDWLRTTTGRHCMTGSCGEQVCCQTNLPSVSSFTLLHSVTCGKKSKSLNLGDMVQVHHSPLSLSVSFDSPLIGITNYFKFTKWCFWIFVILTVINLPALVLNTFGRGDQQTVRLNSLSQTMVLSLLLFSLPHNPASSGG